MQRKISIEDLFAAFQKYQSDCQRAVGSTPSTWGARIKEVQAAFRENIGELAKHIDWTDDA